MSTLKDWLFTPCDNSDLLLFPDTENIYYMPTAVVKRKLLYMETEFNATVDCSKFTHFFHNSPNGIMYISGSIIVTMSAELDFVSLPGAATFREGRFLDNEHYAATLLSLCITSALGRKYPQFGSELNLALGDSKFAPTTFPADKSKIKNTLNSLMKDIKYK
jgi:hypothetical protein